LTEPMLPSGSESTEERLRTLLRTRRVQDPSTGENFEERALKSSTNPLEDIDEVFARGHAYLWWGVGGLIALLVAAIVWMAMTPVATTVTVPIVTAPEGLAHVVASPVDGMVVSITATSMEMTSAGQVLVTLRTADNSEVAVKAPTDGTIRVIAVTVGSRVDTGQTLVLMRPVGTALLAYGFASASQVSEINVGQKALITIDGYDPATVGSVAATVQSVSAQPAPLAVLRAVASGNDALLNSLTGGQPVYLVTMAFTEADTPSGMLWVNGRGAPKPLVLELTGKATIRVSDTTLLGKRGM